MLRSASKESRALKYVGLGLIVLMIVEIPGDWEYPGMAPTDSPQAAREFDVAMPGTLVKLPIHPPGNVMLLTKRPY